MLLCLTISFIEEIINAHVISIRYLMRAGITRQWWKVCLILNATDNVFQQPEGFQLVLMDVSVNDSNNLNMTK